MGVCGNKGIEADPETLSNKEHGIPGLNGVAALEAWRARGRNAAGRRWGNGTGDAEHITGEDQCWIGDMGVSGNQGIEADTEHLGNKEHGIPGLDSVTALEARWASNGNAAGRRRRTAGNTEDITGENHVRIRDMRVSGNQSIEADPETLGNEEHSIPWLNSISSLETGRT